ncbi:MAG: hypothetical protein KGI35_06790, partial [Burkholderiales bacterium]|nr:hypothetical protein [Burkholderiales bacterium]
MNPSLRLPCVWSRLPAPLVLCLAFAGCASYHPLPLPAASALPAQTQALRVDTAGLALPELARRKVDLDGPLDIEAVAALAVLNDPRLRLARDARGVAQAQAFAAGLLPDPQFSASRDLPQGDTAATSTA